MTNDHKNLRLAEVGARIRKAREGRGLNLHELARLNGISASALSLIETGKRDLRVSSLFRIAKALRIRPGELLDDQADAPDAEENSTNEGYDLGDYS
ncbi:MAG: helix-turn-helix transcriptional regulator [Maricaulis sp.]|nr:helix-turn-helix transcriptional regulator [Maricaulis sp.]